MSNSCSNSSVADVPFATMALPGLPAFKARAIHVVASILNEASGLSSSVPRLCQELSETGHSITLMSISNVDQTSQDRYRWERCRKTFANVPIVRKLQPSRTMRRKLHEQARENSVLHAHGLWLMPNIYPSIVARRYGFLSR